MPRRLVLFVLLVIGLVLPSMASARTLAEHQTRVWGLDFAAQTLVEASSTRTPEKHRANSFAYGENASGYSLAAEGGGTTKFYRGMTYGEALEVVENQGLSAPRIAANQALNPGAAGSGAYITSQEATAGYYADLAGLQGRGLGPAVVRMEVPTQQFNAFAARTGISVETPIPRGPFPGASETLIPMQHIGEFNGMCTFCMHR